MCSWVRVPARARAAKQRFLAALRSLKPNCVNHGLCVGDIKPPYASPASPCWVKHTHASPGSAHTHTSQGHLCRSPSSFTIRTMGDRLSATVSFSRRDESLYVIVLQDGGTFFTVHSHSDGPFMNCKHHAVARKKKYQKASASHSKREVLACSKIPEFQRYFLDIIYVSITYLFLTHSC